MIYKNTLVEREKIINKIEQLKAKGYYRRDIQNDRVEMSKIIAQGKKCKQESIIKFVFDREKQEIVEVEETKYQGIKEVKDLLYGWSSPNVETSNAVKAGLMDANDCKIMKTQFTDQEWYSVSS